MVWTYPICKQNAIGPEPNHRLWTYFMHIFCFTIKSLFAFWLNNRSVQRHGVTLTLLDGTDSHKGEEGLIWFMQNHLFPANLLDWLHTPAHIVGSEHWQENSVWHEHIRNGLNLMASRKDSSFLANTFKISGRCRNSLLWRMLERSWTREEESRSRIQFFFASFIFRVWSKRVASVEMGEHVLLAEHHRVCQEWSHAAVSSQTPGDHFFEMSNIYADALSPDSDGAFCSDQQCGRCVILLQRRGVCTVTHPPAWMRKDFEMRGKKTLSRFHFEQ